MQLKFVFATRNAHKLDEIRAILAGEPVELVTMTEAGIEGEAVEDGASFEENALKKAEYAAEVSGLPALADDSGLEIEFMGGAPGIFSARFLGEHTDYAFKNGYILERLKGVPDGGRGARFVCAAAAVIPGAGRFAARGVIEGRVAHGPAGDNGFGYDPIFYLPERGMTTAELPPDEKNAVSHRGMALTGLVKALKSAGVI
jgi:XTP/dITP diphosphohydrolase